MKIKLKRFVEQVMIVTGAISGIGLATGRTAPRRGATVLLVARSQKMLAAEVAAIGASDREQSRPSNLFADNVDGRVHSGENHPGDRRGR